MGRDTRLSGPMLEGALVAGALSAGADVYAVGVLPTPGIAHMTRRLEAHGGVVLSASHNPFEDNGIKIFSAEGAKLPDAWEDEIERRLSGPDDVPRPTGAGIGRLTPYDAAEAEYIAHARHGFAFDLAGLTLVLDCANGATSRVAPRIFRGMGANVVALGTRPDGRNINRGAGALHPEIPPEEGAGVARGRRAGVRRRRRSADRRGRSAARSATATTCWPSSGGASPSRAGSRRASSSPPSWPTSAWTRRSGAPAWDS